MTALSFTQWKILPVLLLIHATQTLAQTVCDAPEVKIGNNVIQIEPTGTNDTTNIQCALDLAVEKNIPEIRLTPGDFKIGALSAKDFVGTLQGGGKDHTRLILTYSFNCSEQLDRGMLTADITHNTFDGNNTGLILEDSNATVTVSGNHFASVNTAIAHCYRDARGLVVANRDDSNWVTRLDIHDNLFELFPYALCSTEGITLDRVTGATGIGVVISNNHFRISTSDPYSSYDGVGISSEGVSGGVVSENLFSSFIETGLAIGVDGERAGAPAFGWTIVSNRGFKGSESLVDISLSRNTSNALVGPDQGAKVSDGGSGNIVLPQ